LIKSLLKQADIVTVISSYLHVTKKGRSYVALCPFHDDKNPSLNISKEKQIFKCFVCGTGGNAITFVEKYEKISFEEAVRKVADLVNFHDERLEKASFPCLRESDADASLRLHR
jgi:DNA primase